jgi:4-amino-4-deoxy-L-arabinose transferase-like glycosyltransferase
LAIVIAGAALRGQAAASPRAATSTDEISYSRIAVNFAERGAYGDPTLRWPPGAPLFFAAAYRLSGHKTGTARRPDIPAAYWAQALAGTLLVVVVFGIAALLAGPVAGLIAAAAIACYPPLIFYTRDLLSEPFGAFVLALAFLSLSWAWRTRRLSVAVVAGFLLGCAVLVRADLLLAPFCVAALAVVVLWRAGGRRQGLAAGAAVALGAILAMAPWIIIASRDAGRFVPITQAAGDALFVGSFLPGHGHRSGMQHSFLVDEARHRNPRLRDRPADQIRQSDILDAVALRHPLLNRSDALTIEALANVRRYALGDPVGYAGMMLDKARRMWIQYSVLGGRQTVGAIIWLHIALVVVSLVGLLAGLWRTREPILAAIALVLAYSTALHTGIALSWPRYALPLLPILAAGGAAGAVLAMTPAPAAPTRRPRDGRRAPLTGQARHSTQD